MEQPTTNPNNTATEPAAFNAAIAILMRLDNILQRITSVMQDEDYPKWSRLHKKYDLVRQLVVQASPLIKDKTLVEALLNELNGVKIPTFKKPDKNYSIYIYSRKMDCQLDIIMIKVQSDLQSSGYFMPQGREKKI